MRLCDSKYRMISWSMAYGKKGETVVCANNPSSTTTHHNHCFHGIATAKMPTIYVRPTVTDTNADASTSNRQGAFSKW